MNSWILLTECLMNAQGAMQQPGRMRCAALLLLVLTLCYATQRAAGKTLPVPYPSLDGAPPVKAFDGPAQGPPSGQTYILLYDNKTLESELLDAGRAIEASGGTVVAQHPAIGVAFATSANDSFAANVKAADPRLTHVASTARVQGRGHRKASVDPRRNSGGGSGRGRSVGGGGGGSASKDRARRLLDGKKGAGARPSSELQGDLDAAAAQRRSLSLEPVQAPSLEAVLSSSPPYAAGAAAGCCCICTSTLAVSSTIRDRWTDNEYIRAPAKSGKEHLGKCFATAWD